MRAIIAIIILMTGCLFLASCATVSDIQDGELSGTVGSFELNPVKADNYWHNGRSYEYNEYEIQITSWPVKARVFWNDKSIGTTPFTFKFTGTLDRDEYVRLRAVPYDETFSAQEDFLRIREELPREIKFDFKPKK